MVDKVLLHRGRGDLTAVSPEADEVELVDGARIAEEITEMGGSPGHEAGELLRGVRGLPPAERGEPVRAGEVVEGHHGQNVPFAARCADPAVVLQGRVGELAFGRLDPAPLE